MAITLIIGHGKPACGKSFIAHAIKDRLQQRRESVCIHELDIGLADLKAYREELSGAFDHHILVCAGRFDVSRPDIRRRFDFIIDTRRCCALEAVVG